MHRSLIVGIIVSFIFGTALLADEPQPRENTGQVIASLLDFVSKSDCTFIRNGQASTGKQASAHMQSKYEHFKSQIKTPEDFIRLAATKSLQTGKPYMVKTKNGQESRCDEWLTKILEECLKNDKDKKDRQQK